MFSKINLIKAYHEIPVADIPKIAIASLFTLFEYLRMPFRVRNVTQAFQRFIKEVTRGLHFYFVYSDDILAASTSPEERADHLRQLFQQL